MSKPINTPFNDAIDSQKGASGNEDTYDLMGDLTIGGSKVIVGVKIDGPGTLFDYLDSGLKD
jgi:hypothetical protein